MLSSASPLSFLHGGTDVDQIGILIKSILHFDMLWLNPPKYLSVQMNSNRLCSLWNVTFVVYKATLGYYGLALGKKYSIAHQTFLTIPPTQSNYNNTPIATGHLYTFCKTSADHTAGFPICTICSFALLNKTLKWDWLLKCHFLWIQCHYVRSLLNFSNKSWAKVCSIKLCFVHRLIVTFNLCLGLITNRLNQ